MDQLERLQGKNILKGKKKVDGIKDTMKNEIPSIHS